MLASLETTHVDFKILSLNVRGLRSPTKRKALFLWLDQRRYDIVFLQETYSTPDVEDTWRTQWQGKFYFSHGSNHSRGVLILARSDLDLRVKSIKADDDGRFIIMEAEIQDSSFLLVNVYAPNKTPDQCNFYVKLNKYIEEYVANKELRLIVGGDFNVPLNPDFDCSGGNLSRKDSVRNIQDLCLDFDLVDIWRVRNPQTKRFTWRQKSPFIQRRLDYWLISDCCQEDIEKSDIVPSINSDHSAITLHLNSIAKQRHGPSFWKFNGSLVNDVNYVTLINESVPTWLNEFKDIGDKRLLWDLIKYKIRQVTIKYSKKKAHKKREKISEIEASLKISEENCSANPTDANYERVEILQMEYDSLYEEIAKGAIIRSKATWYEKGEKSNKYFLNLENHRKTKSLVRKVFNDEGTLVTDPKKVLLEIEKYYSNLSKSDLLTPSKDLLCSFLNHPRIPRLSVDQVQTCEGALTVSECFKCLQFFGCNKSPGNDGLTVEFYKAFWNTVGNLVVDSLNFAYEYGELSNSQKEAIITLIEKKDKDKRYLSNWRPISLINMDVKIGSKAIAKRLENILPNVIHHNQCAYVKGRTTFDAVRTIEDVMDFTEMCHIDGRLICIDFQKAFDTVNREFLFSTLSAFGFGSSFIQWIHTLYNNISSCVLNNGYSTSSFAVERGVRQGDPLSAYLFIMVLEILCISIRSNDDIQGIPVDNEEIKLGLFADDLTGFVRNNYSLKKFLEVVERFGKCSGLKVNEEKTEILLLGNCAQTTVFNCKSQSDTVFKKSVKILGVHFTYDKQLKRKLNFEELINTMKQKLRIWRWRDLTIIGRIQIVKTFIIPIFLYRASSLCFDKDFLKNLNTIIYDFIWKGKDKVKRSAIINDIENGGLKAPHLETIIETQKILCCKKFINDQAASWKTILLNYLQPVGGKILLCCNFDIKKLPIRLPTFYEECLNCFAKCSAANYDSIQIPHTVEAVSNIILWNNKLICIDGKSFYFKTLQEKGILRLGDLLDESNEFIIKSKLRELDISPLEAFRLMSVIDALPLEWRGKLKSSACGICNESFVIQDQCKLILNSEIVQIKSVVAKTITKELRSRVITPPTAQLRFNQQFPGDILDWKKIYSLPFRVTSYTKLHEFQYKVLNKCLPTNVFLHKIGIYSSPVCSFCGDVDETLEHILVYCNYSESFWTEVIKWLGDQGVQIQRLSLKDILFGMFSCDDELYVNHILLLARQYLYSCRCNKKLPRISIFIAKINIAYQLETIIVKSNVDRLSAHYSKWGKYINM